jgi:hypothetical protein
LVVPLKTTLLGMIIRLPCAAVCDAGQTDNSSEPARESIKNIVLSNNGPGFINSGFNMDIG